MIQVLHLLGHEPDLQTARLAEAIRLDAGAGFGITTRTIGRGGDYRNIAQAAMALRFGRGPLFDLVHVWDTSALIAAAGGSLPVVFGPPSQPIRGISTWLRVAMMYRNITVIATTGAMRDALSQWGIAPERCHVIPPAVDFARVPDQRDEALRKALGFLPGDKVLLAPGESSRAAGHGLAVHAASILRVLDERYRVLLWGRGGLARAAVTLASKLHQPRLTTLAEQRLGRPVQFEELLAATDMALVTAQGCAAALPIAMCMAAGLPIVSVATPLAAELLENGRTAALVPRAAPRLLAQQALELLENPGRSQGLGRAARAEARGRFDRARATDEYLSLYRRIAGVCGTECHREPALSSMTVTGPSLIR